MSGPERPTVRPGRRALFSDPAAGEQMQPPPAPGDAGTGESRAAGEDSLPRGRRALFSEPASPAADQPAAGAKVAVGPGALVVRCRTCLARTPMSLVSLGIALIPSLWLPARRWSRLMRCPACGRVSWCRIERAGAAGN